MALQYSPKIVQDSLVMCLDASQNTSYPAADLPVKNGLVMWMDAADDTTFSYSSGTIVSQWRDKSGFNYHMGPKVNGPTRSVVLNSRKVLAFTAAQTIGNNTINLSTSANTVFVVSRLTGTTNGRVLTCNLDSSGNNWLLGHHGGTYNDYYAEGWVSDGGSFDTNWRMYMGDWSGTSTDLANLYSNGTAITTNSSAASQGPKYLGVNYYSNEVSTCEVAEIVVFDRVLSAIERKQVHTYLGQKWGISNTDRSIVDLSNNNNNGLFGNATVANMPDYDFYNKGALTFNGSSDEVNFGDVIKFTSTQNFTLEVWVNYLPNATSYVPLLSKEDSPGFGYALKVDETYGYQPYLIITGTTSAYRYANVNINDGVWHHIVGVAKASSTTIDMYVDGVLINGVANIPSWAGTATTNALRLGKNYGSAFFKGKLSNSKIYNKALSAAEVAQNYEAQKSKFANTIVQQGLVLNLDAGNIYSYAGAGTTWYDVSGNTKDFIIDGSGITYNSGGYFTLADGGITRSATITNSTTCTVVVWIRTTDTQALIFKGNTTSFYLAAYYVGQGFYNENCGTPTYWIDTISVANPNPTYLDGNWHMWEMKNVNFSSWTSFEFNKYSGYTFGNGAVGQIMIYDRNLSSGESLQIYNATKGRFGL